MLNWSPIRSTVLGLTTLVAASCASAGGGGNADGGAIVQMDMGVVTAEAMSEQTQNLFRREQFQVFREEPVPAPMIQSEWRNQTPTTDEQAMGVTEVQVRVVVRGRERPPMGGLRVYQVTYQMEAEVKTAAAPEWMPAEITPQRREMARELGRELQTLLEFTRR
ncbi:hypothetical protein [Gaopeijia maritima]|uniref:Lipoprotein n=1 Tax=Gaopeijia maritima TaxID=3119007 RepID=A0ABU9E8K6_9BACT